jgi:dTDP-4-amino-4,6-dideoxy-D-galactose acyltransferase
MSASHPVTCELLPWDTDFFGCRIARVCDDTMTQDQALQIDNWCQRNQVRAVYFLSRSDDPTTIQTAERNGFGLVDVRLTLERTMTSLNKPAQSSIRSFQPEDLLALQELARESHRDSRFFSDQNFPRQRVKDLYSTWITLETQGRSQIVFVAPTESNKAVGYISCHLDQPSNEGRIGLLGVDPEVRGRGIGKNLVLTTVDWFRSQGAPMVSVVTQGKNLAAQRLYQQCGFLTREMKFWFHKWYPVSE